MNDLSEIREESEQRAKAEQIDQPTGNAESKLLLRCLAENEVGDARLFRKLNSGHFIFDHAASRWYHWQMHHWQDDIREEVMDGGIEPVVNEYSTEAMRQAWAAANAEKAGRSDEAKKHMGLQKELLGRVKTLQTVQRQRNVLTLAAAGTGLVGDEWDRVPMVLACSKGVIDLTTGELRPGRPEDYLKTAAPTEYRGIDEPCPTWVRFMGEVFAGDNDLVAYMARLFGYALTGTTEQHILPIFWGAGRNGKGTLLETIKHVLGDYAFKAESELLLEQRMAKASGAPNSGVLSLRGKRLVWVSETDEGRRLNTSRVKELVGGDTLNARAVYGRRHVEFRPSHLLLMLTNNRPQAPAGDFALWQRIHLVPFTMSFVAEPAGTNQRKADPRLPEKLKDEAPGILAWLVRGCLEYQRDGLNPPASVKAATEEYRQDEDLIAHFLSESCVLGPGCETRAGALYKEYQGWALENGHRPLSGTKFGRDMKERFDYYNDRAGINYIGVGLLARERTD